MSRRGLSLAFSALFFTPFLLFLQTAPPASASPGWWDTAWTKRRVITITGNHPENYQLLIYLPFSDNSIRFLENETAGLLPYWVELDNGSGMKVWVRRIENSDNTIYVYYGNPNAGRIDNKWNVFQAWDNFAPLGPGESEPWVENDPNNRAEIDRSGDQRVEFSVSHYTYPFAIYRQAFGAWAVRIDYTICVTGASTNYVGIFTGGVADGVYGKLNGEAVNAVFGRAYYYNGYNLALQLIRDSTYYDASRWGYSSTISVGTPKYVTIIWRPTQADIYVYNDANRTQQFWSTSCTNTADIPQVPMSYVYALLAFYGEVDRTIYGWLDDLIIRTYDPDPPTVSVGGEETSGAVVYITSITADNLLLDRDADTPLGSITSTRLQADVEWVAGVTGVVKENVRFVLKNSLGQVVDNQPATENLRLADNKQRFFRTFNLTSYSVADNALGTWTVRMEVRASSFASEENACLTVDDLTSTASTENKPGHRLRAYGTASRVSGSSLTGLDNIQIVDTYGTYYPVVSGVNWENIWNPLEGGNFIVYLKYGVWDGKSENTSYVFPNLPPYSISATSSQSVVDRDLDYENSGAVTTTQLTVSVADPDNDNLSGWVAVLDPNNTVVENVASFSFTHNPPDNATMGLYSVKVFVKDNWVGTENTFSSVFRVDDLTSTCAIENKPGHKVRVYGSASRNSGLSLTLTGAWLYDNNLGWMTASYSGVNWENTYAVSSAGSGTAYFAGSGLDGTVSYSYAFPNFSPSVSISASPSLVDRDQDFTGSGATTVTTFLISGTDPDNDNFFLRLLLYDNTGTLRENVGVGGTYVYDPPDNLPDAALGGWTAKAVAADPYGGSGENTTGFTVADLTSTLSFSPATIYSGWPVTVSGTVSGKGYAATADNIWLTDTKHGTWSLPPSSSWSRTYTVTSAFAENVEVVVRLLDLAGSSVIDGENRGTYQVSPNVLVELRLRWENGSYATLPVENENFRVRFYWHGGENTYAVTSSPENFVVPTGGKEVYWVQLIGEGACNYWRGAFLPGGRGGRMEVILIPPSDYDRADYYSFRLVDLTNRFGPAQEGVVYILRYVENELITVTADHWDATFRAYAYLLTGDRYYIRLRNSSGEIFERGLFQAENPAEIHTVPVYEYAPRENARSEVDVIVVDAYRNEVGQVVVVYRDETGMTENLLVTIYPFAGDSALYSTGGRWVYEFTEVWMGAENSRTYRVEVRAEHPIYGAHTWTFPIDVMVVPPPFVLPAWLAGPVCFLFVFFVIASFSAATAGLAAVAGVMTMGLLVYAGLLPASAGGVIAFLLVCAVIWKLTGGR